MPAAKTAVLVLLARSVRSGRVKTRLTPPLDAATAARVYQLLLETTVARSCDLGFAARVLAVYPDEHHAEMTANWPGFDLVLPQGDGDLGQKLSRIFAHAHQRFGAGVVAIGADAPDLPPDRFASACEQIAAGRCAMCASADGGYCLIATPEPAAALFDGIDWGSQRVAAQTRDAAARCGVQLAELEPWQDVDTIEDVAGLLQRLKTTHDPHLVHLRRELNSLKLAGMTLETHD